MTRFARLAIAATATVATVGMAAPAVASPFVPVPQSPDGPSQLHDGEQDPGPDPEPSHDGPTDLQADNGHGDPDPRPKLVSPSDDPDPNTPPVIVTPTPDPEPVDDLRAPGQPDPKPAIEPGVTDLVGGWGCEIQCITHGWIDAPASSPLPVVNAHVRTSVPARMLVVFSRTAPITVNGHTWLTDIEHAVESDPASAFDAEVTGLAAGETWYAAVAATDKLGNIAYRSGSFETPRRRTVLEFTAISVTGDGDSGAKGAGELHLRFQVNGAWQSWTDEMKVSSGDILEGPGGTSFATYVIDDAPALLTFGVHAMEMDGDPGKSKCLVEGGETYPLSGEWRCRQFASAFSGLHALDSHASVIGNDEVFVLHAADDNLELWAHGVFNTTYIR